MRGQQPDDPIAAIREALYPTREGYCAEVPDMFDVQELLKRFDACQGALASKTAENADLAARLESREEAWTESLALVRCFLAQRDKDVQHLLDTRVPVQELRDAEARLRRVEAKIQIVLQKYVALQNEEIRVFGGVVSHGGRCGRENNELREALTQLGLAALTGASTEGQ
jgi:hypothetical protein